MIKPNNDAERILDWFKNGQSETLSPIIWDLKQDEREKILSLLSSPDNQYLLAQLIYYLKYIEQANKPFAREIENIAIATHGKYIEATENNESTLPYAFSIYSEKEQKLIIDHLNNIQLSHWCDWICNFMCLFDAVARVRDTVPILHTKNLLKRTKKQEGFSDLQTFRIPTFHWANDFLGVYRKINNYYELINLHNEMFNMPLSITSSIPPWSEHIYKELIKNKWCKIRVSLSKHNCSQLIRKWIINGDNASNIIPWHVNFKKKSKINDKNVISKLFMPWMEPYSVALVFWDTTLQATGINRYELRRLIPHERIIWNWAIIGWDCPDSVVMTPYWVFNIISINAIDQFPQWIIAISIKNISDKPFNASKWINISSFLWDSIIVDYYTCTHYTHWRCKIVKLKNFYESKSFIIDQQWVIISTE